MPSRKPWDTVDHLEKIEILKALNDDEIVSAHLPSGMDPGQFRKLLLEERDIWKPTSLGHPRSAGAPPNKETVMGAWRDLNRAEALLELIDNSIDAWTRRRKKYASKYTSKTLQIYIDLYDQTNKLTYEDNAGGVKEEQLPNIVIPGFSETADTEATIGSYRTGGKKAIFKLAADASIQTYYFDPDGTTDDAFDIHLDSGWLHDPELYEFPYFPLNNRSSLSKGHTVYTFRLRDHIWDETLLDQIINEIRRTYTLLMIREQNIEIYFNTRTKPLQPLEDLYVFSGAHTGKIDVRPQKVIFKSQLAWGAGVYPFEIEVVLGCRTTTAGAHKEDRWGIDIYGNNRLFVHHNQDESFKWFELPMAQSRLLVRGFINIIGPNVFMPWDTHKRHLNVDREMINVLRSKPIKDLFAAWKDAYNAISGMEEIKKTIKSQFLPWKIASDLNVAFSNEVTLPTAKRRGVGLPTSVHTPKVKSTRPTAATKQVPISFKVTQSEFRGLCTKYEIETNNGETQARKQLSEAIKTAVLKFK